MSDESTNEDTQGTDNQDGGNDNDTGSSIASLEDALKVIESLRKENASKRVKAKEVEEKAKKWEEHVQSQKTDLEKLTESKASLEQQLADLRLQKLREDIAKKEGVPEDLVTFMNASDEDGLREQAKKLATAKGAGKGADFFAGQRGKSVGSKEKEMDLNSYFADMWREAEEKQVKRSF